MNKIDSVEPLYPCPRCEAAMERIPGRDYYYCRHCNTGWTATAMAMIAYPPEGDDAE